MIIYFSMPLILVARPGDAQALKCAISAKAAGTALELQQAASIAAVQAKGSNAFATNSISLVVSSDVVLTESNAIAGFLGNTQRLTPIGS